MGRSSSTTHVHRFHSGWDATGQLLELLQGPHSAYDYTIKFRILAAFTSWDPQALYDAFLHGLSEEVMDHLLVQDLSNDLNSLMELAERTDV